MKILLGIFGLGVLMVAGGVGLLVASGYDAASFEIWSLGVQSLMETPSEVIQEVLNGAQKELFGGIVAGIVGVGIGVLALLLMNVLWISAEVKRAIKRRKSRSGWSSEDLQRSPHASGKPEGKKKDIPQEEPRKGPGLVQRLRDWRATRKQEVFKDATADLEEGEKTPNGIQVLMNRLMQKLRDMRGDPKQVVIQSGDDEKVVIEVESKEDFEQDLKTWFRGIRGAQPNDAAMIETAQDLKARATKRMKGFVTEQDPMNGEFMLRMLEAWSAKKLNEAGEDVAQSRPRSIMRTPEQSVFVEAIADVERDGVRAGDAGEDLIPDDGMEDPEIIDDVGYSDDLIPDDGDDGRDEEQTDPEQTFDINDQDDSGPGVTKLLAVDKAWAIIKFQRQASSVQGGDQEWDEDLADEEMRRELVEEMVGALQKDLLVEWDEIQTLSQLDMGDDEEAIEWIKQDATSIDELRENLHRVAGLNDEKEVVEDDREDLDAAFSIRGIGTTEDGAAGDEDHAETAGLIPDDEGLSDVADASENAEEEGAGEDGQKDDEAEVYPVTEVQPRNLSLDQLDEIEKSGELIYKWGHAMRSAGAAEARLCHSVLAKDGVRRRVVGIVHLVAKWREEERDDGVRINIVLRYLPEGEWFLDDEAETPRMVNLEKDFVEVSKELIEQEEVKTSMLIVHFYGPGAPDGLKEEGNKHLIVTEALSAEAIKGIVGK